MDSGWSKVTHNELCDALLGFECKCAPVEYEWGVVRSSREDELHRGPMTEAEARKWIEECIEMGFKPDMFRLVKRPIVLWEIV